MKRRYLSMNKFISILLVDDVNKLCDIVLKPNGFFTYNYVKNYLFT